MIKTAYSLFELIFVLFLLSFLSIYTLKYIEEYKVIQNQNQEIAVLKLDMNSTKIFIERNLPDIKNKLFYKNQTLFFGKNILLKNVSSFSKKETPNSFTIKISLKNKISQIWKYKL